MAESLRSLRRSPAVVAGLAFLVVLAWPLIAAGGTRFIGDGERDAWGTQWFYWLIGRRLLDGEPFAHTDLLFHPWGKDVYAHTGGNVLDAFLALPLRYAFGPVLGYDLFVLGIVVANGFAVYALCRSLRFGPASAATGALLGAFNPYVLGELSAGRPTQALLVFPILAMAGFLSLEERPSWRRAGAAALFLGLSGLNYWFHAIFLVLALAPLVLMIFIERGRASLVVLGRVAGALALSVALVLPLALPMLGQLGDAAVPGLLDTASWSLSGWSPRTVEGWHIGIEALSLPGFQVVVHHLEDGQLVAAPVHRGLAWVQLATVAAGLALAPSLLRRRLVVVFVVALLISVGPRLFEGVVNPAYLALVEVAPPLKRLWWPARAVFLLQVVAALSAAVVVTRVPERFRAVSGVALFGVLAVELWAADLAPLQTVDAAVPEMVGCLARVDGALIEVPLDGSPERLHWQAVHGRPLFGGMIDDNPVFAPVGHTEFRERNSFIGALSQIGAGRPNPGAEADDVAAVEELGIRWLVLDSAALPDGGSRSGRAARTALGEFLGPAVYDDGRFALYSFRGESLTCP